MFRAVLDKFRAGDIEMLNGVPGGRRGDSRGVGFGKHRTPGGGIAGWM